jgi:ParB family transcriptional regulator, chromosome partitioning protein
VSSRRGLPDYRRMRHDRHFVDDLSNRSVTGVGFMVPIDKIETNREQPRTNLGDLAELAASIRARGVLEPLLVRPLAGTRTFQLIAGERRLHAAVEAGLAEVPCIEILATDEEAIEIALVENLQRKDLSPFEEAEGYRTLADKYAYSHDQVAKAVGKSRPTVTETLKLLTIPPAIRDLCRHADITAKSLLLLVAKASTPGEMESLLQEIASHNLDRESARAAAKEKGSGLVTDHAHTNTKQTRFRPINIRFRGNSDAPVRISMSIRAAGITKQEVIATLEELLHKLRRGELDAEISAPQVETVSARKQSRKSEGG